MTKTNTNPKVPASGPDAKKHNPDPAYLRDLVAATGLSQRACARIIGVSERSMRDYLNPTHPSELPYPGQYALERLAASQTLWVLVVGGSLKEREREFHAIVTGYGATEPFFLNSFVNNPVSIGLAGFPDPDGPTGGVGLAADGRVVAWCWATAAGLPPIVSHLHNQLDLGENHLDGHLRRRLIDDLEISPELFEK